MACTIPDDSFVNINSATEYTVTEVDTEDSEPVLNIIVEDDSDLVINMITESTIQSPDSNEVIWKTTRSSL